MRERDISEPNRLAISGYRLREERARFEASERQELEARLVPVKKELAASLKKADAMSRLFWSQSLKHLGELIQQGQFEPDHGVTLPSTEEQQGGNRGREEFAEFVHSVLPRRGFILSGAGEQRLLLYGVAQMMTQKADLSNPETWSLAFDRLYRLEVFDEKQGEVGYDESQREVVPEPVVQERKPTLEAIDCSTRDGAAQARALVANEVFVDGEASKVFHQFVAHVAKPPFSHDLTADEQYEIVNWFQKNNRSFLDHKAYDTCRVNLARRGLLPHGCLTEDEVLSNSIEDEDTSTWTGRRNLKQELIASRRRA